MSHGVSTRPALEPPSKGAIYPDKYRPRAPHESRNAAKKRWKRKREAEALALGTSSNPINLDADDAAEAASGPTETKRQKIAADQSGRPTIKLELRGPCNPVHASRFPNTRLSDRNKENIPPPPSTTIENIALAPKAIVTASSRPSDTLTQLDLVRRTLQPTLTSIHTCQHIMKDLYDADEELRAEEIFRDLVKLRDDMHACEMGAENGVRDLGRITQNLMVGEIE